MLLKLTKQIIVQQKHKKIVFIFNNMISCEILAYYLHLYTLNLS